MILTLFLFIAILSILYFFSVLHGDTNFFVPRDTIDLNAVFKLVPVCYRILFGSGIFISTRNLIPVKQLIYCL